MKIRLTVEIEYNTSEHAEDATALSELQDVLHTSIERVAGEGGFSGTTPSTVDTWEMHTEEIE